MKTISLLLFIVVVTITAAYAQDQKKSIKINKGQNPGSEKMLNPQPLPPKADKTIKGQSSPPKSNNTVNERGIIIVSGLPQKKAQNQGNEKMLNPQPLPPKEDNKANKAQNSGNEKMLNPQPLPPKANIEH